MIAQRSSPLRDRLAAALRIALATAMLMWPTFLARRPAIFFDTDQYWWRGRMIVVDGLGLDRGAPTPFHQGVGAMPVVHGLVQTPRTLWAFIGARSASYSLFVFLTQQWGTLRLTAAVTALLTALGLYAVWRAAAPKAAGWTYLAMMAVLSATTSLAFFASFPMPDVFAGLGVLTGIGLVIYWDRLAAWTRLGLWVLLTASLTFHDSHLLLAILTLPAAVVVLWRLGAARTTLLVRTGALTAAIGVAALSGILADKGVQSLTGIETHRPPFLSARILADGPGRAYLRRACARATPYFLCRFKTLPLTNSDDILWSDGADTGVFMISSYEDRLKLEAEQSRFVRDVILADPLGVGLAALRNTGRQLDMFAVDEPLHDPCGLKRSWSWSRDFLAVLVVDLDRCGPGDSRLMSPLPLSILDGTALLLSIIALWRLARARWPVLRERADGPDALDDIDRLLAATGLAAAAILLNAAICGVLSGPFPRYEARLIWLVPALALMAGCTLVAPALAQNRLSLKRSNAARAASSGSVSG